MGWKVKPGDLLDPEQLPEIDRIAAMRMHRLIEAGYTSDQADKLSQCTHVDLHQAENLVRQVQAKGLKPEIAFEILI